MGNPMIGRLNHVAIAVPDLEAAANQYRNALGANVGTPQDEPDHGVTVIFPSDPSSRSLKTKACVEPLSNQTSKISKTWL